MAENTSSPVKTGSLPQVTIYTDGACDPNPGVGGWAALLRSGSQEKVLTGGDPDTTNNRMELTAAIEAFKALKQPCQAAIYTDSEYVKRGIQEWLPGWRARGWRRKGGALANVDLWQELDKLLRIHQVEWHWVHGHSGQPLNERVDMLAKRASQEAKRR